MIFAIRKSGSRETLVEFPDWGSFTNARREAASNIDRQVSTQSAFQWVRDGHEHAQTMYQHRKGPDLNRSVEIDHG